MPCLRLIRILSGIGHRKNAYAMIGVEKSLDERKVGFIIRDQILTGARVFQFEILIVKRSAPIDRYSSTSVSGRDIPALNHKLRNDTMELDAFVAKFFFVIADA